MRNILLIVLVSSFALIGQTHSSEPEAEKHAHHDHSANEVPKVPDELHELDTTTVQSVRRALLKTTGSFALKADRTKPLEKFVDNLPKRPLHTLKEVRAKLSVPGLAIKKQKILEPKKGPFAGIFDDDLSDESDGYAGAEVDDIGAQILDSSEEQPGQPEEPEQQANHDLWEVRKGEWILCQVVSKSNWKSSPFCKNCYVCRNVIKLNKELHVRSASDEIADDEADDGDEPRIVETASNDESMQPRRPGRRPGRPRPHTAPRPKPRPNIASVASILHKKKPLESPLKAKLIHQTAILPTPLLIKKDSQTNRIEKVQKDRESETMTILKRAYNEKRISLKEYLTILNNLVYLSNKPLLRVHGTMIPHDFRVPVGGQRSASAGTTAEPETGTATATTTTTSVPVEDNTLLPVLTLTRNDVSNRSVF